MKKTYEPKAPVLSNIFSSFKTSSIDANLSLDVLNTTKIAHISIKSLSTSIASSSTDYHDSYTLAQCHYSAYSENLETQWKYRVSPDTRLYSDSDLCDHNEECLVAVADACSGLEFAEESPNILALQEVGSPRSPLSCDSASMATPCSIPLVTLSIQPPRPAQLIEKPFVTTENSPTNINSQIGLENYSTAFTTDLNEQSLALDHLPFEYMNSTFQGNSSVASRVSFANSSPLKRKRSSELSNKFSDLLSVCHDTDTDAATVVGTSPSFIRKKLKIGEEKENIGNKQTNYASTRSYSSGTASSDRTLDDMDPDLATPLSQVTSPSLKEILSPVPIIAPPEYHLIPSIPLSQEDAAEIRIRGLLTREAVDRSDGSHPSKHYGPSTEEERVLKEVAEWILDVLPPAKKRFRDLRDQLETCPVTRFDAALLFHKYLSKVSDALPKAGKAETRYIMFGRHRIYWDSALSCLALSIKFHRDFLAPFSPMSVQDFIAIAPRAITVADFELCQRDILEALEYRIWNVTPASYMQEIWSSLSSLRSLLKFDNGWESAQEFAWERLYIGAIEPSVLRFPISVLTAAALADGIEESLLERYEKELVALQGEISEVDETEIRRKALQASKAAIADLLDILKLTKKDIRPCRDWLNSFLPNIKSTS